eukprot:14199182-Ditylum_brightwellii.AAC.1
MTLPAGAYGFISNSLPPKQFEEGKHSIDMWMKTSPAARKVILADVNVVGFDPIVLSHTDPCCGTELNQGFSPASQILLSSG